MRAIAGSILVGVLFAGAWIAVGTPRPPRPEQPRMLEAADAPDSGTAEQASAAIIPAMSDEAGTYSAAPPVGTRDRLKRPKHFEIDGQRFVWIHGADFTNDGALDAMDIAAFRRAWIAGDGRGDFNSDRRIDAADLAAFLHAFAHGEWNAIGIC